MRAFRLSRKQPRTDSGDEAEPLAALRRRCGAGAVGSGCCYLAVTILSVVHPSALSGPATFGLLIAFGTPATLCALGAVLLWTESRHAARAKSSSQSRVDEIDWAIHLGAEMAEAFPDRELGRAVPRGPSIR